jgi:hypothetical protein
METKTFVIWSICLGVMDDTLLPAYRGQNWTIQRNRRKGYRVVYYFQMLWSM